MQTSQEVSNIFKAICECKKDFLPLQKNKQGYGYKYVTLDAVIDMLNTVLPKHGLGFIQFPSTCDGEYTLTTRVIHESGEWLEDTIKFDLTDISKANDTQKLGASVTYFRRYTLSTIFGIAADEDVDGNVDTAIELRNNQQPQRKQFNETSSYNKQQPQQPQPQQKAQQTEQVENKSFFVKRKEDELYFTTNNEVNSEIEALSNEVYHDEKVLSKKTIDFIKSKCDSNAFSNINDYVIYIKRASATNKKRIDERIEAEKEKESQQENVNNDVEF